MIIPIFRREFGTEAVRLHCLARVSTVAETSLSLTTDDPLSFEGRPSYYIKRAASKGEEKYWLIELKRTGRSSAPFEYTAELVGSFRDLELEPVSEAA
jgi:hypothetical protein